jgi:hypothetical protein
MRREGGISARAGVTAAACGWEASGVRRPVCVRVFFYCWVRKKRIPSGLNGL